MLEWKTKNREKGNIHNHHQTKIVEKDININQSIKSTNILKKEIARARILIKYKSKNSQQIGFIPKINKIIKIQKEKLISIHKTILRMINQAVIKKMMDGNHNKRWMKKVEKNKLLISSVKLLKKIKKLKRNQIFNLPEFCCSITTQGREYL